MVSWQRSVLFVVLCVPAISGSAFAQKPAPSPVDTHGNENAAVKDLASPFLWIAVTGVIALASGGLAVFALMRQRKIDNAPEERSFGRIPPPNAEYRDGYEKEAISAEDRAVIRDELQEEFKKNAAQLRQDLSNFRNKEERERESLQANLDATDVRVASVETSSAMLSAADEDRQEQLEEIEAKLKSIESKQQTLRTDLAAYASLADVTELEGRLSRRLDDLKKSVDRLRKDLDSKTLESDFDVWKAANLSKLTGTQATNGLAEFRENEQNTAQMLSAKDQLSKLWDRVSRLATVVEVYGPDFEKLQSRIAEWEAPARQFCEFRSRTLEFRDGVGNLLSKTDIESVKPTLVTEISFTDLVTGKSAEFLRDDFGRRLSRTLSDVLYGAEQADREWQSIRADLLGVLDIVHPAKRFANFASGEHTVKSLMKDLEETRVVQEIEVPEAGASYDPMLHEPIAGERQIRPELPENTIVKLVRRGYYIDSKVQRRALVSLSSKGVPNAVRESA